ncbi:type 1 fimbrial protein [Escherichia coli]|nr:type 1 fimbrial protein [Escherichia coli]
MIKTVMAGAVAMALVSFGANAADQGHGKVNFKGTVIDAPCGIHPDSVDQTIDFGQISKAHLNADGESIHKQLKIELVNCDFSEPGAPKTVKVAFSGTSDAAHPDELGTAGGTGTAVVVSASDGSFVKFDGSTPNNSTDLKEGNNTLNYMTWVKKASNATDGKVKEGDFTAVANFNLTYN